MRARDDSIAWYLLGLAQLVWVAYVSLRFGADLDQHPIWWLASYQGSVAVVVLGLLLGLGSTRTCLTLGSTYVVAAAGFAAADLVAGEGLFAWRLVATVVVAALLSFGLAALRRRQGARAGSQDVRPAAPPA